MKTLLNFRFFVVLFLSFTAGIFAVVSFYENTKLVLFLSLGIILGLVIYLILCKIINKNYFIFTKLKVVCILIIVGAFIVSALLTCFKILNFNPQTIEQKVAVTGSVLDVRKSANDNNYIIIENVKINGEKSKYNIVVYYENEIEVQEGYKIYLEANLVKFKLITLNGLNTFASQNNVGYSAFAETIEIKSTQVNFLQKFKIKVWQNLHAFMDNDSAGLSFAVLFGDRQYLDHDIKGVFTASGVAHLLAISGLHVGIFVAVLYFVLNKLKVKKYINFIVTAIVLLIFNTLCGFSESVLRASIMSLCLLLSTCFGKRRDSINNLSLAGIILLLVNPLNLYEIGFQLSFLAVFGILLLNRPINSLLLKIKCPNKLAGYISTTLSASILTLPIIANIFGVLPIGFVVANLLLIPLFTIYYISLLITTLISFVPVFVVALKVPQFVCEIMINTTGLISKFGSFKLFEFSHFSTMVYILLCIAISKYAIIKPLNKSITACVLIIVLCVSLIFQDTTQKVYNNSIFVYSSVENCSLVASQCSNTYIFNIGDGDEYDILNITELLNKLKIKKVKAVVISNYNAQMQLHINTLLTEFYVESLYIPNFVENFNVLGLSKNISQSVKIVQADFSEKVYLETSLYFYGIYTQENVCKYLIYNSNNNVVSQNVTKLGSSQITNLQEKVKEAKIDVLIQNYIPQTFENSFWLGDKLTYSQKCYLENLQKVVINNSFYVKMNLTGDISYEIYWFKTTFKYYQA